MVKKTSFVKLGKALQSEVNLSTGLPAARLDLIQDEKRPNNKEDTVLCCSWRRRHNSVWG